MSEALPIAETGAAQRAKALLRGFARSEAGAMLMAFTVATLVVRLASNIALTHILEPSVFGVMGVIASVMTVLAMLSDLGFATFIIGHDKGDDPKLLDVTWTIRLAQASAQAAIMLLGAGGIAHLLGKPEMAMPIAICAPVFVLNALCPMSALLAQRQGLVRKGCAIELGSLAAQIGVNVALAFVLRDYRALVVGLYVGALAKAALTLILLPTRSRLRFDRAIATEFFGFSRIILASTFVTLLITQSDKIIFARLFTLADFGIYMLAVNLALALQPFARNYVLRFFFPLVSRTWRSAPESLPGLFYAARRRTSLLMFATFGLGAGLAPVAFHILFDHRYQQGWVMLAVLLLRGALDLDSFASTQTLMAMGRARTMLQSNLLRAGLFAAGVIALYRALGPLALPVALALAELGTVLYFALLLRRLRLFVLRDHAAYYAVLLVALAIGAAISAVVMPAGTFGAALPGWTA